MKRLPTWPRDIALVARGEADPAQADPLRRRMLAVVRYADPAAWSVAAAAEAAIAEHKEQLAAAADRVAVLTVSQWGTADTMAALRRGLAGGTVSPLRFPAASPGSLAGLTSIACGLHGPTLHFTQAPDAGVPLVLHIAGQWLRQGIAAYALVAAAGLGGSQPAGCRARCLLLAATQSQQEETKSADFDAAWLAAVESAPAPSHPAAP